jgi:hypothetical protein
VSRGLVLSLLYKGIPVWDCTKHYFIDHPQ